MAVLAAVSPAKLPAAISPVFTPLRELTSGSSGLTPLAASSWSPTVSRNR
jgi:hypothetical protein